MLGSLSGNAPHTEGHQCCLVQGWIIECKHVFISIRMYPQGDPPLIVVSDRCQDFYGCQWELSVILVIVSDTARAAYSDHVVCYGYLFRLVFFYHICWAICFLPVFVLYAVIVIHVDLQTNAFIRTPIHHAWFSRDASVILTWIQMKKKNQNVSNTNWSINYLPSRSLFINQIKLLAIVGSYAIQHI